MGRGWSAVFHAVSALCLLHVAGVLAAAEYPNSPIRIIVPFSPGSSADLRTRQVAQYLAERFAKPVVVENKPGASGILGMRLGAKAPPDGYTLTFVNNSTTAIVPQLHKNLGFDIANDFSTIALMAYGAAILVTNPAVPANTVKGPRGARQVQAEFLDVRLIGSRQRPAFAHGDVQAFGRRRILIHVPFKGDSDTLTSLLGGHVSMTFAAATGVLPHIKSGKLKALAVGGRRRLATLPDVPTMAEAGYPAFEWHNWFGFVAPSTTPKDIVARLNKEMMSFLALPNIKQEFLDAGYEIAAGSPEDLAAYSGPT